MPDLYKRHDLLNVHPQAWAVVLARRPDLDGIPHLRDWARQRRPVIVRRRHSDEEPGCVAVGLPLPPADGKRRIDLALPTNAVHARPPVALRQVATRCPAAWSTSLADVLNLASRLGLVPYVFGSLLWQSVTGLPYLAEKSDLDLLWPVDGAIPRDLLSGLAAIESQAPMRIDGDILLPGGGGVNWRELHAAPPEGTVLVKHIDHLALSTASALLAGDGS